MNATGFRRGGYAFSDGLQKDGTIFNRKMATARRSKAAEQYSDASSREQHQSNPVCILDSLTRLRVPSRSADSMAFDVAADLASIIGVFYGGHDHETILHEDPNDKSTGDE